MIFIINFQGGSQQVSELLVEKLGKDKVLLETPVQKIVQNEDG